MARVGDRKTQELQRPFEGLATVVLVVLGGPAQRAFDLAADIGQLLHKGELAPPAPGQIPMLGAHSTAREPTIWTILPRIAGSSTPRERFP